MTWFEEEVRKREMQGHFTEDGVSAKHAKGNGKRAAKGNGKHAPQLGRTKRGNGDVREAPKQ